MATVYFLPENFEIKVPEFRYTEPYAVYQTSQKAFIDELKQWLKKYCDQEYVGEVIWFPVADGKAMYMVASMKPLKLVHLPLGDAWEFQYVNKLSAKDVKQLIDRDKRLAELFGSK